MTNERLKELLKEFVEEQDNTVEDEWYMTNRGVYKIVINDFEDFLRKKKIRIKGDKDYGHRQS